jgi:hypothetical protein
MVEKKGKILVKDVLDQEERFTNIKFLSLEMSVEEVSQVLYNVLEIN